MSYAPLIFEYRRQRALHEGIGVSLATMLVRPQDELPSRIRCMRSRDIFIGTELAFMSIRVGSCTPLLVLLYGLHNQP